MPTTTTLAGLKAIPVKAKYIIASDSSFAPLFPKTQVTNLLGIDMELITGNRAKDQALKLKSPTLVSMQLSVLSKLVKQMVSLLSMSVTDARKATFDFSESYYTANTILGVKESSTIASYEDLKGKTVRC